MFSQSWEVSDMDKELPVDIITVRYYDGEKTVREQRRYVRESRLILEKKRSVEKGQKKV